jgi:hypothetical protein
MRRQAIAARFRKAPASPLNFSVFGVLNESRSDLVEVRYQICFTSSLVLLLQYGVLLEC